LQFQLTRGGQPERALYIGTVQWESVELAGVATCRYRRILSAKFSLGPQGLALEQGILDLGRSHVDMQAEAKDLSARDWTYRYRGCWTCSTCVKLSARQKFHWGALICRGEGSLEAGRLTGKGNYAADNIKLSYEDFPFREFDQPVELRSGSARSGSAGLRGLRAGGKRERARHHAFRMG